ncbi:hypothetical protein K1719_009936 [Acacia pycnantha]|nr:hypothetical protein K1719_009936 [Acacia pycnantha]
MKKAPIQLISFHGDDRAQQHQRQIGSPWGHGCQKIEHRFAFCQGQFLEFQTEEECEYLINLAEPHMQKSTVLDLDTGKIKYSRVSTCSETFLPRGRDKIVRNIEKRIADFTSIPVGK